MSKHSEDDVAYHEAGHAVVAFFLGLSIGRHGVTIVPSKDYLGVTHIPNKLAENPEYARSGKTKLRIEKLAIMFRAGDIAERKHNPECRRDDRQDRGNATDLLDCISSSRAVTRARLNLAYAEAKDEVEHRWEWIDAVAKALLQRKHLTKHEVEDIVRNVVYREDQEESRP